VKEVFTGDARTFHAGEANTLALGDALGEYSLLTLDAPAPDAACAGAADQLARR
jgi:hypothetical protein